MFLRHSQHTRVRELLDAGRLGELRTVSAAFCFPPLPDGDIRYEPRSAAARCSTLGVYPIRRRNCCSATNAASPARRCGTTRPARRRRRRAGAPRSAGGVLVDAAFGFEHTYGSWYSLWGSAARLRLDKAFTPPPNWQPVLRLDGQDHGERLVLPADDQFARTIEAFAGDIRAGLTGAAASLVRTMELVQAEIRPAQCAPRCATGAGDGVLSRVDTLQRVATTSRRVDSRHRSYFDADETVLKPRPPPGGRCPAAGQGSPRRARRALAPTAAAGVARRAYGRRRSARTCARR